MNYAEQLKDPVSALKLFRTYSVEAGDGTIKERGDEIAGINQYKDDNIGGTIPAKLHHSVIAGSDRKALIELRKSQDQHSTNAIIQNYYDMLVAKGFKADKAMEIAGAYRDEFPRSVRGEVLKTLFRDKPDAYTTEMYFLPWDPSGGAVELQIPAGTAGPIIFLTAALSGCSVFVDGTPQNPRIFHCGTSHSTGEDRSAKEFWKDVMQRLGVDLSQAKRIHNVNYGVPLRGEAPRIVERQQKTKTFVESQKDIKVQNVDSWGAVFGIRTGPSWTFYLQENVSVSYQRVNTKPDSAPAGVQIVARPRVLRQIFPGGGGRVRLTKKWQSLP